MEILKAKDYSARDELEKYVTTTFGKDVTPKDVIIKGNKKELAKLSLSHTSIIWGISCEETGRKVQEKVLINRGKIFPSKINGQITRVRNK